MIDLTKDIHSLTAFRRNSSGMVKQLKKTKRAIILTVKGKAEVVVQDAASYQRLLDIAAAGSAEEGIRQGKEQAALNLGQDLEEFFAEFEAEHGIQD